MNTLSEPVLVHRQLLSGLFDWLFPVVTYFVSKFCRMPTAMAAQELIFSHTKLLKCLLDFDDGAGSDTAKVIEGSLSLLLISCLQHAVLCCIPFFNTLFSCTALSCAKPHFNNIKTHSTIIINIYYILIFLGCITLHFFYLFTTIIKC